MKFKVRVSAVVERVIEVDADMAEGALSAARQQISECGIGIHDVVGHVGYDLICEDSTGEELVADYRGIVSSRELISRANNYKRLVITNFFPDNGQCLELILERVESTDFEAIFTFTEFRKKNFLSWFTVKLFWDWMSRDQHEQLRIQRGREFRLPKPVQIWSQGKGTYYDYGYRYAIVAVRFASIIGNQSDSESIVWTRKTTIDNSKFDGV